VREAIARAGEGGGAEGPAARTGAPETAEKPAEKRGG